MGLARDGWNIALWHRAVVGMLLPLCLSLLASCGGAQRALMYLPTQNLPHPARVGVPEMAPVVLTTADGLALASWHAVAADPARPTIVFFHGNAGSLADRAPKARRFLDRGYGLLLVGYRGYGGNPGTPGEQGLIADGRAALDFLANRGIDLTRTVLLGESLGSAVAVALASEFEVAAVLLEVPFTSVVDVGETMFPLLPLALLVEDRYDTMHRIAQVRAPLLIIHGNKDRIVPAVQGRRLLAAAPGPKQGVFLPEAGHNNLLQFGSDRIAMAFLDDLFSRR